MKRPVKSRIPTRAGNNAPHPRGYTMIEILVATALMLIIMLAVASVLGMVGQTISNSRGTLEMSGALRAAAARLSRDLKGVTVTMSPPRDPGANEGYFEYTEGPIGPVVLPENVAKNIDVPGSFDSTVGDIDDILMFTTGGQNEVFLGQVAIKRAPLAGEPVAGTDADGDYAYDYDQIQAKAAEVAWFVRGHTLYRRELLIVPGFPKDIPRPLNLDRRNDSTTPPSPGDFDRLFRLKPAGFYNNDVSIRLEIPQGSTVPVMVANTLSALTKPENRFAHRTRPLVAGRPIFPFHPHFWINWSNPPASRLQNTQWATLVTPNPPNPPIGVPRLGLPTLQECSHPDWIAGGILPIPGGGLNPRDSFDAWINPHAWQELDPDTGTISLDRTIYPPSDPRHPPLYMGPRVGEDVILTNVISFDVKAWDPRAPVLPGVNAMATPTDPTDDRIFDADGDNVADVAVAPGDPGYPLALGHFQNLPGNWPPNFGPLSFGAYVDLNYSAVARNQPGLSPFAGPGQPWPPLMLPRPGAPTFPSLDSPSHAPRVYDTWSTHYENNWVDINLNRIPDPAEPGDEDGDPLFDEGANGVDDPGNGKDDNNDGIFDNNDDPGNGVVDDIWEQEAPAPYPVPLRGIQIKIRVFEPDSRQIREVTIVEDFVTR